MAKRMEKRVIQRVEMREPMIVVTRSSKRAAKRLEKLKHSEERGKNKAIFLVKIV